MPVRLKTFAISGTGQAEQKASHSPVMAVRSVMTGEWLALSRPVRSLKSECLQRVVSFQQVTGMLDNDPDAGKKLRNGWKPRK